jgi:hypothetical protein
MSMILGDAGGDGDGDGDHVPLEEANLGDSESVRAILLQRHEMERSQQSASPSCPSPSPSRTFSRRSFRLSERQTPSLRSYLHDLRALDSPRANRLHWAKSRRTAARACDSTSSRYTHGEHVLQKACEGERHADKAQRISPSHHQATARYNASFSLVEPTFHRLPAYVDEYRQTSALAT